MTFVYNETGNSIRVINNTEFFAVADETKQILQGSNTKIL